MDINEDQSIPRNDLHRTVDGKYIYQIDKDREEVDKFNREFDQYKIRRDQTMKQELEDKLAELNKPNPPTPLYEKSVGEIVISTKDTILNMLDDIIKFTYDNFFTKDNRLFYIGLIIIMISLIISFIVFFNHEEKERENTYRLIITNNDQ